MKTGKRVHTGRTMDYTESKEATLMNRKPFSRKHCSRAIFMLFLSVLLVALAGTLFAQDRGIGAWEAYVRSISSFPHLQALSEYMASITGEGHAQKRADFLANPRATLQEAGIPVDLTVWTIIALDMQGGVEAGAFGFSPMRDADIPTKPHTIGSIGENVVLALQLKGEADPGEIAEDVFFTILLNVDDLVVADLSRAVGLLDAKSPSNVDRELTRQDAYVALRDELGVEIDRYSYSLVAIDFEDADAAVEDNGGKALYTIDGAGVDPAMGEEVIGFIYGDIGVLLQAVR